jgi:hypothetical protein
VTRSRPPGHRTYLHCPKSGKKLLVSTVRLAVDHGFLSGPRFYETMIFEVVEGTRKVLSWRDLYCDRYATAKAAKRGHNETIDLVLRGKALVDS